MDFDKLTILVEQCEGEGLEFKKSTGQLQSTMKTLCGFLNARGGKVLIGVTQEGDLIGQHVSDRTLRDIASAIRLFEPPAPIEIDRIPLKGSDREIIVLKADPSQESRPFTYDGRPYQRIETTISVMPQEKYQNLLLERVHARHRWENALAADVKLQVLDEEEMLRTIRIGIEKRRLPESMAHDPNELLERLHLQRDGKMLNAAVVLFGTQMLPDFPQCEIRMARFRGINKTEFLDERSVRGHIFHLLDEAMLFLNRHLPISGRIEPGRLERVDEPLFPSAALREALVNAFCHRDYSIYGGCVSLAIFDDRLEIWSDGTLPFGLKVEELKIDHKSIPRNPIIADVLYRRGLVERWGRGTQDIVALCVKAGHPEPVFIEEGGAVGVRFLPKGYIAPHRVAHDLTSRQREILEIVASNEKIPLRRIMEKLTNPPASATVRDDLYLLKRLELITSIGHGKGAVWSLVVNQKDSDNKE